MSVAEYDEQLVEEVAARLTLRAPNKVALDKLARAIDVAAPGAELVADLATGVGKTYVAGALLDYLFEAGVRNVLIVTPGSTIQRKTVDNLTPGRPKYLSGLASRPSVITMDDFERGTVGQDLDDPDKFKVFVMTVQSLLAPNTKANRRAHNAHEAVGQSLAEYLRNADDLVVIADEHHVYFSGKAKQFQAAISGLSPAVTIGLTATPHPSTPPEQIVYQYPLAEAIADGFVKIPVLVARADGLKDTRAQMADGVALLNAKRAAMAAYCARTKDPLVEPVMLVVASNIDEATDMSNMLAGPDMLGDQAAVLLVTSEEPDETLRLLDGIEDHDSKVRAVVSVSMLKEGWDCKSIYVIASVRAMESQLLTEQILGRGLRLPFGRRTGVGMLDTVEVLSHHKFSELLAQAEVLLAQTLGERAKEASAVVAGGGQGGSGSIGGGAAGGVPVALPGTAGSGASTVDGVAAVGTDAVEAAGEVVLTLPGLAPGQEVGPGQLGLFDVSGPDNDGYDADRSGSGGGCHDVGGLATIEARLAAATAATAALTTTYPARALTGMPLPLFIPRVSTTSARPPFSLSNVNVIDVEALGTRFANENAPSLRRKALDATRDEEGVHLKIEDLTDEAGVAAYQPRLPFNTIEQDLVTRLLNSNDVAATATEASAASTVAAAFMRGAGVGEDTPWRAQHGQLATEALVGWIRAQQAAVSPVRTVTVAQAKFPEPPETTLLVAPVSRHVVTNLATFTASLPYRGWRKSVFDVASFHAYSTEFRLAEMFETDAAVTGWVRVGPGVPLALTYDRGAGPKLYEPDFIVVEAQTAIHWIVEGKADKDMTDPIVLAKEAAAKRWVSEVNGASNIHTRWGYLLGSESAIKAASGSWNGLKAVGQSFIT